MQMVSATLTTQLKRNKVNLTLDKLARARALNSRRMAAASGWRQLSVFVLAPFRAGQTTASARVWRVRVSRKGLHEKRLHAHERALAS